jgi:hypothetical protein
MESEAIIGMGKTTTGEWVTLLVDADGIIQATE